MKQLLLVFMMTLGITSYSQSTESVAYATPKKDTLYVVKDMFIMIETLWNQPRNIAEKPVLIPVESILALKMSLGIKED